VTVRTRESGRRRSTAAQIVGTVGVLGVAATIAGLGTLGNFTDSTAPVDTTVDTGVLSIDVADAGDSLAMPFGGGLILAGDSRSYRLDLVNDGDSALSSVTMTSRATASSILDTDTVNGLQLTATNCSVPWTVSNSVYSCAGTPTTFYSGPIVVSGGSGSGSIIPAAASLAAGGVDHLLLTATLPAGASGDAFEGATSSLEFFFSGTQRAGSAR
jgi:hypothetical protein